MSGVLWLKSFQTREHANTQSLAPWSKILSSLKLCPINLPKMLQSSVPGSILKLKSQLSMRERASHSLHITSHYLHIQYIEIDLCVFFLAPAQRPSSQLFFCSTSELDFGEDKTCLNFSFLNCKLWQAGVWLVTVTKSMFTEKGMEACNLLNFCSLLIKIHFQFPNE